MAETAGHRNLTSTFASTGRLYSYWNYAAVEFSLQHFSFVDHDAGAMTAVLLNADILYTAGVFEDSTPWVAKTRPGGYSHALVDVLQARVQYNMMAFIDVCGGSQVVDALNGYGSTRFCLLRGARVRYDSNCGVDNVKQVTTNVNEIQMTTGCGVAIHIWQDTCVAISFPVCRTQQKSRYFVEKNSVALCDVAEQKAKNSTTYGYQGGPCAFCLAGYEYLNRRGPCRSTPDWQ